VPSSRQGVAQATLLLSTETKNRFIFVLGFKTSLAVNFKKRTFHHGGIK
jgi:hypothetical protein